MMKKILVVFCMLNAGFSTVAMESKKTISVPVSQELEQKFNNANLAEFAQQSRLPKRIGGKECNELGLNFAIQTAVMNYQQFVFMKTGDVEHLFNLEQSVRKIILS